MSLSKTCSYYSPIIPLQTCLRKQWDGRVYLQWCKYMINKAKWESQSRHFYEVRHWFQNQVSYSPFTVTNECYCSSHMHHQDAYMSWHSPAVVHSVLRGRKPSLEHCTPSHLVDSEAAWSSHRHQPLSPKMVLGLWKTHTCNRGHRQERKKKRKQNDRRYSF